jgi:hypothetical protein
MTSGQGRPAWQGQDLPRCAGYVPPQVVEGRTTQQRREVLGHPHSTAAPGCFGRARSCSVWPMAEKIAQTPHVFRGFSRTVDDRHTQSRQRLGQSFLKDVGYNAGRLQGSKRSHGLSVRGHGQERPMRTGFGKLLDAVQDASAIGHTTAENQAYACFPHWSQYSPCRKSAKVLRKIAWKPWRAPARLDAQAIGPRCLSRR